MSVKNMGRGRVHWLLPLITLTLLIFEMTSAPDLRLSTWLRRKIAAQEPTLPSLTETSWQAILGLPASHVTARYSRGRGRDSRSTLSPDPALDRAAQVLLQLWIREHPLPRGAALRALVAHSGGVIWDHQIRRLSSQSKSAHRDQIEAALEALASEQSLYRFGRATEAYHGRQWTLLLMTRHRVDLVGIPRQISAGQSLSLSGCVSTGYRVSSL
ncbi:MAG: hypothetical protein VYD19_04455, partial [Myxococcota bacterium]|nr:hypothetical protein [Myxococcota bacterium]